MPSIDERVVSMAFENAKFESGVAHTMATLSKLDVAIKNIGSTSGLQNIEAQANKVTLAAPMSALEKLKSKMGFPEAKTAFAEVEASSHKVTFSGITGAIDKVTSKLGFPEAKGAFAEIETASDKVNLSGLNTAIEKTAGNFSVLSGAAAVAIGNISSQAAMAVGKAVTQSLNAIKDGFSDYELKIGSTQTIMAGTGENIGTVTKYLKELDVYADRTIYNLRDMTGNIGKFTNAGVKLPLAVNAMKGIANLAALSGANTEEAARAMYNLGQSIGQGTVRMADWRSVDLANMGTKEFKEQLIDAALAAGTLTKGSDGTIKSLKGNEVNFKTFGVTLQDQWLTAEALTTTLNKYSDETTGLGKRAYAAASDVKTMTMGLTTLAAAAGTSWTDTFDIIIGNLPEATKLWTNVTNAIGGFIGKTGEARNKMLKEWKDLGGREELIKGLKDAFGALFAVLGAVGKAFRDVFPAKTGADLYDMTKSFAAFAKALMPSDETLKNLRRTFQGFFAVLSIGWSIVKGITGVIFDLLGVAGKGSGGFLEITGSIGDFLSQVDVAIKKGGVLTGFFESLTAVLKLPLELLRNIAGAIGGLFGAETDSSGVQESLDGVRSSAKPLTDILDKLSGAWDWMVRALNDVAGAVKPVLDKIVTEIQGFAGLVANAIDSMNWDAVFLALQTTFLGGLFLAVKKAIGGGIGDIGGGVLENVNGILKGLTGNLEAMQKNIQAKTLLAIASAIAVLAAGIFVLSTIDGADLSKAMTAVAVGMGELVAVMFAMSKAVTGGAFLTLPFIAAAMIGLAVALVILAGAMKLMATMSWEELAKGLVGLGGALAAVGVGTKLIAGPQIIAAGLAMIPLAIGINLLALAMKQLGGMKWEDLAKGLAGVAGALLSIAAGMVLMPPTLPVTAVGILILSGALILLSGAIASFGNMDPKALAQGLLGVGLALSAIGLAIALIPPTIALQAAGLVILGIALTGIAGAVALFGSMDLASLAKGIVAIAGTLLVLAVGLTAMTGTLGGSIALLAAAGALAILAPTLAFMGTLKWSTIFKGLAAIALVLGTLALVGAIASTGLIALGGGFAVLGLGMTTIAAAIYLAAKGISLLAEGGQKGVAVLLVALTGFVAILPTIVINFVKGLVEIANGVAQLAPKIIVALGLIIDTIIAFVIESAPKLAIAIGVLLTSFTNVINDNSPSIIATGWKLLQDFLSGISRNIGQVVTKVTEIITKFLTTLAANAAKLAESGAKVLISFLTGITNKIPALVETVAKLIGKFIGAVASHIPKIVAAATNMIVRFIEGVGKMIGTVIKAGTNLILSFMDGIGNAIPKLVTKGLEVARKFLNGIADGLSGLADVGFKAIIRFLNGLEKAIRENMRDLIQAGAGIADAIIDGLVDQFGKAGGVLRKAIEQVFDLLPGWAKKVLGISSPSKVFAEIGKNTMLGYAKGVDDNHQPVRNAGENISKSLLSTFKGTPQVIKDLGKEVGRGFAQGLEGSASDIRGAFQSMNEKLKEQMRSSKETIASEQTKLDDLLKAKKPDYEAIAAAQKAILESEKILKVSKAAHEQLTVTLKDEKKELIGLTKEYEAVSTKLEAARTALDEATRARDTAQKSFTDKYSATPDIGDVSEDKTPAEVLAEYKKALADRITATKSYAETLQKLRALGLDDTTYKKLLEEGVAGKDFAEELLKGGKTAVIGMNELDAQLIAASTKLATDAAVNLYQAGVNAAQGLVDGLKAKKDELAKSMDELAASIVNAIKKRLKIKSPSQVFGEVGKFAVMGLAKGLQDSSKLVTDAASGLGTATVSALQSSVADISSAIADNIDADPVITPILDLSSIEQGAKKLDGLTNVTPITAAASYGQASVISADQAAAVAAAADQAAQAGPTFQFEQNNYSPEALADVEIYRQTKNQLSQVKSALGLTS